MTNRSTGAAPGRVADGAPRIDFARLAQELLASADALVPSWLPDGKRESHEWKCGSLSGGAGTSCSINLKTGQWADFATDDKGGDLVSLYACIHGMPQIDAARELIDRHNLGSVAMAGPPRSARASQPSAKPPQAGYGAEKGEFVPVLPVPAHAPPPPAKHPHRGAPEAAWHYTRDGASLGHVYRFRTSDGGKEVLPLTWCQSQANGTQKWAWKTWQEPRPLYLPGGALRPVLHRLVVEGEKCADAAHALVGAQLDVLSWPGGGKAASRADWSWVATPTTGQRVYLWPDCDAKRFKLSAEQAAAGMDPLKAELLPSAKQPGQAAMDTIAALLHAQGCEVWMCHIPEAGTVADGWDVADAIEAGWSAADLQSFLDKSVRWLPAEAATVGDDTARRFAGADGGDSPQGWRVALIKSSEGAIKPVRENVVLALQSLPDVAGKICNNEFANDIMKMEAMPWGSAAGKWSEVDELLMGEWLCRTHWLPSMPRGTLEEAVRMVATRHQYHPVRKYLGALRHDGVPRLNTWLARAVCADPAKLTRKQAAYMSRVGAWFLMAMAARALQPGCKFDYMLILEGAQGLRKSTVLNVLAGDWFADTGFMLGDKDSLQMLQGRWLYEISELDAMARAEVTKIKAFVASKADWYRASFDKRPREYPRQLVFAGTTNEHQYLVDGTGNRRFWPVDVSRVIDTEWVQEIRDQLFAEAVARVASGERYHPTGREELELFLPQQRSRMVESPIEMRILDYLVNNGDGMLLKQVQIVTLLAAIHIDITKLGPGRFHERQAGTALKKYGWTRTRASSAGRPWVYTRPDGWPECINLDDLDDSKPIGQPKATPAPANYSPGAEPPTDDESNDAPF